MASKPAPVESHQGSRETLYAIIGSLVVSLVLATILTGNPFSSLVRAYTDYSREPLPAVTAAPAPTPAPTPAK